MIGPKPPPYGGVATFLKSFIKQSSIQEGYEVNIYQTGKRNATTPFIIQLILEIILILKFIFFRRYHRYDIYHIHTASYYSFLRNIPYVYVAKNFSNGKVILHIHGAEFDKFYGKACGWIKYLITKTLNISDSIIVTSKSWINKIESICGVRKDIYSIPNGFDPNKFQSISQQETRLKLGLPRDKKILINIGHLEEYKGQKYLIEAIADVVKWRSDFQVYIIGSGSLQEKLYKLISDLKLENFIIFAGGNKPHDEIPYWLNSCDLFILPSIAEGNPTVMFECLGCGKPFVGTKVGGVPDIVISEEYGLLCEPANSKDLAEKILYGLTKEWDSKKIIKYAEQFTWENIARKVVEVYENTLKT